MFLPPDWIKSHKVLKYIISTGEPITRRDVRRHLRSGWIKLQPIDFQNNKQQDTSNITAQISRNEKTRMIMSARGDLLALGKKVHFRNIVDPGCVTDIEGGTLIHLGVLDDGAVKKATEARFHWDDHDEPNSLCFLVALGDFEGGQLCFPQLQILVPLKPGQIVAFSSRFLLHGNFPVTRGIRHSVVYFVHGNFFHHLRDFTEIYKDRKDGIERDVNGSVVSSIPRQDLNDARGLNRQVKLDKPKANQIRVPPSSTDCRRGHIDLRRTRWGLKAEDPLPDGL